MPPHTQSQSERQPDKNLTFTQFFTKLLIKVPQVDIEKLPAHLLRDIVPSQDQIQVDQEEYKDEKEADIYSLEHQENVEEFKPKDVPVKFTQPLKVKNILPDETNPLKMTRTVPDMDKKMISDDETDSITCTVEESDLNCPQEEMLDLTITDEFTEECVREDGTVEEKEKMNFEDSRVPEELKKDDENTSEKEAKEKCLLLEGDAASDIDQDCAELIRDLEQTDVTEVGEKNKNDCEAIKDIDICLEDKIVTKENTKQEEHTNKCDKVQEVMHQKEQEDNANDTKKLNSDKVQELNDKKSLQKCSEAIVNLAKSDPGIGVGPETHVGPQGGYKDCIAAVNLKHIGERSDSDSESVSNDIGLEHITSTKLGDIEASNKRRKETPKDQEDSIGNENNEWKNKKCIKDGPSFSKICDQKEQYSIQAICDSLVQVGNFSEEKISETNTAAVMKLDHIGGNTETKLECGKNDTENKMIKEFNIEENLEPPVLKIRIFKGNSGELINEKEAKRTRKRKKRTARQRAKMARLNLEKAEQNVKSIATPNVVENNTQNRIIQELPGCNWLEQKIKNGKGSKNVSSCQEESGFNQLDSLLETDSDDDYLVVDDQTESCEVTTNFKEDIQEENDIDENNTETLSANQEISESPNTMEGPDSVYPMEFEMKEPEKEMEESEDKKLSNDGVSNNDIQDNHPFTYMLGNLMKKMDNNQTKTNNDTRQELTLPVNIGLSKQDIRKDEKEMVEMNKTVNTYEHSIAVENQTMYKNGITEKVKQIPYLKRQVEAKLTE